MFAALSISAFAGSNSFSTKVTGYTCSGSLPVNAYSASASLSSVENPGEPIVSAPVAIVNGTAYDSLGNTVGTLYSMGEANCSARTSWSGSAAKSASCTYKFMGTTLKTLTATV